MAIGCPRDWTVAVAAARERMRENPALRKLSVPGCVYDESRNVVDCAPTALRASVEQKLTSLGLPTALSLDAYIMARNIASEAGTGSAAEKVGIGEALANRSRENRKSFAKIAMRDGARFGSQHGTNPAVSTRQDPSYEDIVIANLVLAGCTGNLVRGATQYWSPASYSSAKQVRLHETRINGWGDDRIGYVWVGHVEGIDPSRQFFMAPVPKGSPLWLLGAASGRHVIKTIIAKSTGGSAAPSAGAAGGSVLIAAIGGLALVGALIYAIPRLRGSV